MLSLLPTERILRYLSIIDNLSNHSNTIHNLPKKPTSKFFKVLNSLKPKNINKLFKNIQKYRKLDEAYSGGLLNTTLKNLPPPQKIRVIRFLVKMVPRYIKLLKSSRYNVRVPLVFGRVWNHVRKVRKDWYFWKVWVFSEYEKWKNRKVKKIDDEELKKKGYDSGVGRENIESFNKLSKDGAVKMPRNRRNTTR